MDEKSWFTLSREPISSGSNDANSLFVQRQRLWNDRLAKALVARGMNRVGIGACTVTSRSLKKSSGMNQTSLRAFLKQRARSSARTCEIAAGALGSPGPVYDAHGTI